MSELKNEVRTVLNKPVEISNINYNIENDQISKKSKAYSLDCSIMFVDMRGSTIITDENSKKNMVRIYKALARVVTYAATEHAGEVKQIVGDGFLCLFVNDEKQMSAQKAKCCSESINTYIEEILNPEIKSFSNPITVGYGICSGNVLISKVGRKGRGKVATPIFAGSVTNYASKYCSRAKGEEVIIDENTWGQLSKGERKDFTKTNLMINDKNHDVYCAGGLKCKKN